MAEDRDGYQPSVEALRNASLPVDAEVLGVRIQALAEADRLESEGDLRKWRFSEVRLNADNRRDV